MTRRPTLLLAISIVSLASCATITPTASSATAQSQATRSDSLQVPARFVPIIREASEAYRIDPALIATVVYKESRFDPNAVSSRGAQGLMQLMPRTAKYLGVSDPFDPRQNILGGTRYLREMLDEFDGDVDVALAAYNAGPQAVKRAGLVPPTAEADEYVRFIRAFYRGSGTVAG